MIEELQSIGHIEYEPKRINKFRVEFPEEFNIESFSVYSADKPKWVNGKWVNITIKLVDFIGPSTSQRIFHNVVKRFVDNEKYSFDYKIIALDPIGCSVEQWTISVENIDVNFGGFSYDDVVGNSLSIIELNITPRNCVLNY